jgi:predicted dehydrogenase
MERSEYMKKYNVLIISSMTDAFGDVNFNKIVSFVHAFTKHPGFDEIVFYDEDKARAAAFARMWKDAKWTNNYKYYMIDYLIDVVIVATSDNIHYKILKEIAMYPWGSFSRIKLLMVEKPITTDLSHTYEIVSLYKAKGIPLMVLPVSASYDKAIQYVVKNAFSFLESNDNW